MPRTLLGQRKTNPTPVPPWLRAVYHKLSYDLWKGKLTFGDEKLQESRLLLSRDADAVWCAFTERVEPRLADEGDLEELRDWAGKLPGAVLRVAGVLHVAEATLAREDANAPIAGDMMIRVCRLAEEYWVPHAVAAFALMAGSPHLTAAERLFRRLTTVGEGLVRCSDGLAYVTRRDCFRIIRGTHAHSRDIGPVLKLLTDNGYFQPLLPGGKVGRGRPSERYAINPLVLKPMDKNHKKAGS